MDADLFVAAQDPLWDDVLTQLRAGAKRTHWMWFVFPQVAGLGRSAMAQRYALTGLAEAREYLAHPVLGPRLRECTELLTAHADRSALQVMGPPDDVKLRSSMTLFARADPDEPLFGRVLEQWYRGEPDPETLSRL